MWRNKFLVFALVLIGLFATNASATYTQQYTLSQDATFQGQVEVAMITTCAFDMTEAATIVGHVQRMALCQRILQNPSLWTPIYAVVLASQSNNPMTPLTVPSTVADTLVQTASDAQLTNVAGYYKQ
jgi:hypothetical protein